MGLTRRHTRVCVWKENDVMSPNKADYDCFYGDIKCRLNGFQGGEWGISEENAACKKGWVDSHVRII